MAPTGSATFPVERLLAVVEAHHARKRDPGHGGRLPREWEQPLVQELDTTQDRYNPL